MEKENAKAKKKTISKKELMRDIENLDTNKVFDLVSLGCDAILKELKLR